MARKRRRKSRSSYAKARRRALARMNAGRRRKRLKKRRSRRAHTGRSLGRRVSSPKARKSRTKRRTLKRDAKGRFVKSGGVKRRKSRKGRRSTGRKAGARRRSAKKNVNSARNTLAGVRKELTKINRKLAAARGSLVKRKRRRKGKKARKNPNLTAMGVARYAGSFVGGFAASNLLQNSLYKLDMVKEAETKWLPEYAAPAALAGGLWWATKKRKMIKDDIGMGLIAGVAGAVLARNVNFIGNLPGVRHMLGWLAMGVEPYATKDGDKWAELSAFYAGAAGMGRYITDDSMSGMGRYLQDDSVDGLGRYVTVPVNGLGSLAGDEDAEELMDEVSGASRLTVAEAEAENINPGLPVVRATPQSAQRIANANIGQIIGESRQVPGTYLVATSVAGRDIDVSTGPRAPGEDYPSAGRAFGPKSIGPAQNIDISPHGVFSRGVFSSTLPTHSGIAV